MTISLAPRTQTVRRAAPRVRRGLAVGLALALALALAGCRTGTSDPESGTSSSTSPSSPSTSGAGSPAASSGSSQEEATPAPDGSGSSQAASPRPGGAVRLAFAGDVHFAGSLAGRLDDPATAIGPMSAVLADADVAMVNLETAVTTRGTPQTKQYVFRAPPSAFTALKEAGVDVVTMANNHGLDYGPVGIPDARAASRAAGVPMIGLGRDAEQAYAPWITTVKGRTIAFLAASAVVDAALVPSWSAGRNKPGVATALDGDNAALVAAVRAVRPEVDTVVVDLHYGADLTPCPTQIQRDLADDLAAAGADVVVGSHAHILLGGGYRGSTYVDFGLGNFEFYVSGGGPTAETGVLVLTAKGRDISRARWVPGRIEGGVPVRLRGAEADAALQRKNALRECAGLSAAPGPTR